MTRLLINTKPAVNVKNLNVKKNKTHDFIENFNLKKIQNNQQE
ncbi:hypothetical protein ACQWHL_24620 [Salmonella enterica subsp. enterica serovar Infantis]